MKVAVTCSACGGTQAFDGTPDAKVGRLVILHAARHHEGGAFFEVEITGDPLGVKPAEPPTSEQLDLLKGGPDGEAH